MLNLVSEKNFEIRLNKNYLKTLQNQTNLNDINIQKIQQKLIFDLKSFQKNLPKSRRTILVSLMKTDGIIKNQIITLENPLYDFKKLIRYEENFYTNLKSEIVNGKYEKITIDICKEKEHNIF